MTKRTDDAAAPPRAILLGGGGAAATVLNSLGPAGIPVWVLGDGTARAVRWSRWCRRFVDLDPRGDRQGAWLRWLIDEGPGEGVVLPIGDDGVELIARNRARLAQAGYLPPEGDDDVMLAMIDKERTYELAERTGGIPFPRSIPLRTGEDVERAAAELRFPFALKPAHSHRFNRHFGAVKLLVVGDPDELRARMAELDALELEMFATELIPGGDDTLSSYFTYRTPDGELLFEASNRKLRQYPIDFGVGSYFVTEWDEEVAEMGRRFVHGVGLVGIAQVEFKRDADTGELKLIECNHRFSLQLEMLKQGGADAALLVYDRAAGRPTRPLPPCRDGVRLWYPLEDFSTFLKQRARGEITTLGWLRSVMHPTYFPVFNLRDPLPSLINNAQIPRRLLRARRRGRGPSG
jgi:predicted ATP-grasp superfamily ATP-dependent carboligase